MELIPRHLWQKLSATGAEPASFTQSSQTMGCWKTIQIGDTKVGPTTETADKPANQTAQISNRARGGKTTEACIFMLPNMNKPSPSDTIQTLHHGCLLPQS
jgi:hypothetical protein